jgi:hypothetical protein
VPEAAGGGTPPLLEGNWCLDWLVWCWFDSDGSPNLLSVHTDCLMFDVLTFIGDGSRADADDVVGISMLCSAELLVPVYSVLVDKDRS